ncbi:HEPN domain-containing protein [Rahnella aceris]|uniref:HEPN domain-containing protein n=1 Tax=Rahnella sp. (strain Y9602) TaxID=2703885 RepID=UPI001F53C6F0|nr:HEPN domain-containing protein [Rahnella aceris]UNK53053.1 HEPN domain-containing protein [Rahnella aceris]
MTTALYEVSQTIPIRISELNNLTDYAEFVKAKDEVIYNSLCRSTCVLISAHLEGFLKEIKKAIIQDLNFYHQGFASMPIPIQRLFCEKIAHYEGVPTSEVSTRIKQLIDFFSKNSVPVDLQAFNYKENPNKNPNADFIDLVFEKMGLRSMLNSLTKTPLERVFENNSNVNNMILRELKKLRSVLYKLPCNSFPSTYAFEYIAPKGKTAGSQSMWHSYMEQVLQRRHTVAHGDTMNNLTTSDELKSDIIKLEVLMHGILFSAAYFFIGKSKAIT